MKNYYIGKKLIGTYDNGVFRKDVLVSRHLFRVLDAWGVDSKTLHSLPEGSKIVLDSVEEGKWYTTTKEEFLELGEAYLHFKQPKEDYRTQLFLKRYHWRVEQPKQLTLDQIAENDYRVSQGLSKRWL